MKKKIDGTMSATEDGEVDACAFMNVLDVDVDERMRAFGTCEAVVSEQDVEHVGDRTHTKRTNFHTHM